MPLLRHYRTFFALLSVGVLGTGARGQTRWTVDPKSSLAWWQVNPHLNHLWATTCPEETSWRPGEGRSAGWFIGQTLRPPKQGYAAVSDTTVVPLYPRPRALPVCTEAVQGEVTVGDTVGWREVQGQVTVTAEDLITGYEARDVFTREKILQTEQFPEIRFRIDSLVNVTQQADTLFGTAMGLLWIHGYREPMAAHVRAWHEARGLRVLGRFRMPASNLVPVFGLSRFALGLGVVTRIWIDFFMGVDLVLRQAPAGH